MTSARTPRPHPSRRRQACFASAQWIAFAASVLVLAALQPERSALAQAPGPVARHLQGARLVGDGTLRWFGFRVYDARLWAPRSADLASRWAEAPFALEIEYARSLDGAAIAERSHDEMARMGYGTPAKREAWLAAMRRLFPDVEAGSRLIGVHRPGVGASFYAAARPLGEVADPEFARAFFAIWLDERTSDPDLRAALLATPQPMRAP